MKLPGNRTTTTVYDKMGRPVSVKDPLNLETTITYNLAGNRTAITQAFGTASARTTGFTYDAHDRLTLTTHPDTTTTSQTYHPGGAPHISVHKARLFDVVVARPILVEGRSEYVVHEVIKGFFGRKDLDLLNATPILDNKKNDDLIVFMLIRGDNKTWESHILRNNRSIIIKIGKNSHALSIDKI